MWHCVTTGMREKHRDGGKKGSESRGYKVIMFDREGGEKEELWGREGSQGKMKEVLESWDKGLPVFRWITARDSCWLKIIWSRSLINDYSMIRIRMCGFVISSKKRGRWPAFKKQDIDHLIWVFAAITSTGLVLWNIERADQMKSTA